VETEEEGKKRKSERVGDKEKGPSSSKEPHGGKAKTAIIVRNVTTTLQQQEPGSGGILRHQGGKKDRRREDLFTAFPDVGNLIRKIARLWEAKEIEGRERRMENLVYRRLIQPRGGNGTD